MLSITDGEILRFILHTKLPLEKMIRYELASRGASALTIVEKDNQMLDFIKKNIAILGGSTTSEIKEMGRE